MTPFIHHCPKPTPPKRVVLIGAGGVVGKSLERLLAKRSIPTLSLKRSDLDLTTPNAHETLANWLHPHDALVLLATITPDKGRGVDAFMKNLHIGETLAKAIEKKNLHQAIYFSTDSVYPIDQGLLSEESPSIPENLYGAMHLAREYLLSSVKGATPLAILRSTLIYSAEDTHQSYGPNRMRRSAEKEGKITLFGGGEEKRDHIFIEDVSELTLLTLLHQSSGVLNLATGQSISNLDLAHKVAAQFDRPIAIEMTPRMTPITHRHFNPSRLHKAFPSFTFTPLDEGLPLVHQQEFNYEKV